jgi:hypothetical protein
MLFVGALGVLFKYDGVAGYAPLNRRLRLICWVGIVKGQLPAATAISCCSVVQTPVETLDVGAVGLAVITLPT